MFVLLWIITTPVGVTSGSIEFASQEAAIAVRDWLQAEFSSVSAEVFPK